MLKRVTAICVVLCLGLPTLSASASAHSILWVSTSDCTCLVKDEDYAAEENVGFLLIAASDVDAASESIECTDGLEIFFEEAEAELDGVEEPVQPEAISLEEEVQLDLISVENEPEELEEIEMEENTNGEIQIP